MFIHISFHLLDLTAEMDLQFTLFSEDFKKCVEQYDTGVRGKDLKPYMFYTPPSSIEHVKVLNEFLADQEQSQFTTDLSELLVVAMELLGLRDAQQLKFKDILHMIGAKVGDLDCLKTPYQDCVSELKSRLDEFECRMLGTIDLFYGVSGESDPLVLEAESLLNEIKDSHLSKKAKLPAYLPRAQILNNKWKVRFLALLQGLGGFMSAFYAGDKKRVNSAIKALGGKKVYLDKRVEEEKMFYIYAWRFQSHHQQCVKIGITSSTYEALMSTHITSPMSYQSYRTSLPFGISCSRIHQVARCLIAGVGAVEVLSIQGPYGSRQEAQLVEMEARKLFQEVPAKKMIDLYRSGQDGHTEFVEWEENLVSKLTEFLQMRLGK